MHRLPLFISTQDGCACQDEQLVSVHTCAVLYCVRE